MKKICLLGASGSIGKSTLDIVKQNPQDFEVVSVSIGKNIDELIFILNNFPSIKSIYSINPLDKNLLPKKDYLFFSEKDGFEKFIDSQEVDMIVNALVGFVGLVPTIYALEQSIDVCLANKESLVVGGSLIKKILANNNNVHLYPIDSEHVALAKCLKNHTKDEVNRLILTASGGSFRDYRTEDLTNVTVEQALAHPSWKMGAKITIDSATMINKGFEIIEAYYLFDFPIEKIDILLHDESVIHSLIELKDHSFLADLGPADMRIPISYALYEENYHGLEVEPLDLEQLSSIHFRKYDSKRYKGVELCKRAIKSGDTMPCVLNAANEAANLYFREGKLPFIKIVDIIEQVMNEHRIIDNPTLEDLLYINNWAYHKSIEVILEEK